MSKTRLLTFTLAIATIGLVQGCPGPASTTNPTPAPTTTPAAQAASPSPSAEASPSPEASPTPSMEPSPSPSPSESPSPTPSPSPSATDTATVSFKDSAMAPASVTIVQGGTVKFENDDTAVHSIVPSELFDFRGTGDIEPGSTSRAILLNGLGTHTYYCSKHPDEKGSIMVVEPK